jgi:hypothetical protein
MHARDFLAPAWLTDGDYQFLVQFKSQYKDIKVRIDGGSVRFQLIKHDPSVGDLQMGHEVRSTFVLYDIPVEFDMSNASIVDNDDFKGVKFSTTVAKPRDEDSMV